MDQQPQEDWLDARLREEALYIDDAGFTAQVVQKLPPRPAPRSFRAALLLCLTLLASVVTYTVSDGGRFLISAAERVAALPILFLCLVAICCGLVITGVAAGAAFSKAREAPLG